MIKAHLEVPEYRPRDDPKQDRLVGVYEQDARRLGQALVQCLPGGTIDRLLVFLLEHRASLLRVPYPKE